MDYAIEIADLGKSFGALRVIDGLHLRARVGQTLALLGPSGCGKSTVLNLLAGLERGYNGAITILGHRLKEAGAHSPQTGYMLQKDLLLPWCTIEQNVFLPRRIRQLQSRPKSEVKALFAPFGLAAFCKSYPSELSGGMRQRANLLRTYSIQSKILLLDEPFGALDALTRRSLQYWFLKMNACNTPANASRRSVGEPGRQREARACNIAGAGRRTIVLVTHDIREAILLADQVIVLSPRPCCAVAQFDVHGIEQDAALEAEIFGYLNSAEDPAI